MSESLMRVFIGLGTNLGNREANLRLGIAKLSRIMTGVRISSIRETEAVGPSQPAYLNGALEGDTDFSPSCLLHVLKTIEYDLGRRQAPRWTARPLDLDILFYGSKIIQTPDLCIPHPEMHHRRFVLEPLDELDGNLVHPLLRKTIKDLLGELK
ncbi:2-amino-4-hydroxy-6-hydroxymethyldihydropteridine diphosphokinase [Candidatus Uhrbacteria bacterium]|nr:2-amino-4-hydroxy-6-hydroxymethyldihydropteridine diphosphokinase [Candidatus Uhrbacteria bacterium]